MYIYIYIKNDIVRLSHLWSGDSHGKKTFSHPLLTSKPTTLT